MTAEATDQTAPIAFLEARISRLTIRCDAIEGVFFTIAEQILAALGEAEARTLVDDLRANIMIGEARLPAAEEGNAQEAERIALETEAYATRLLDQIERSASVLRKSKGTEGAA